MNILMKLSLCLSLISLVHSFQCPNGSQEVPGENSCIHVFLDAESYNDAVDQCMKAKGIPVKITNVFENAFAFSMLQEMNGSLPFIGVEKQANGSWMYSDGRALAYQNWAAGEPANNSNKCAILTLENGSWKSADCSETRPFICSVGPGFQKCPDNWVYFDKTGYCYYLQNFSIPDGRFWAIYDYNNAETYCVQQGGHLASIHSLEEDNFVSDLAVSSVYYSTGAVRDHHPCDWMPAWIGYTGDCRSGSGHWSDGTPVDYCGTSRTPNATLCPQGEYCSWQISNDDSCDKIQWNWELTKDAYAYARFLCKMESHK